MRKTILFLIGSLCILSIVFLTNPFATTNAAGSDKNNKRSQPASGLRGPANYDALADSQPRAGAGRQLIEGGRAVQTEPRFDVPTFLWASDPGEARPMRRGAAERREDQISAARSHLSRYSDRYRLAKNDILSAKVGAVHDTGRGAIIVKLRQDLGGVEVFRDEVNVIMNRDLQLVAISGYLTGDHTSDTSPARNFTLRPEEALSRALADLTGKTADPALFQRAGDAVIKGRISLKRESSPYTRFTAQNDTLPGFWLSDEPSRTKPVMFHLPDGYTPAYFVETFIMEPTNAPNVLDASGGTPLSEHGYTYVISAIDGRVLFRKDLMAEQQYTYRVWADPVTKLPYDTPAGNGVHPKDTATPNGAQYPFAPQQDVTLQNFPFSNNDPWLTGTGATETNGNNADAFLNLFNPDGLGNPIIAAPVDPITGDFRAQRTAPQQFLHSGTGGGTTYTAEARQSSIQQLFYNVNFLHDFFYDAGFDEASGNAQTDNYTRGGLAADNIKAQVDDFAGFNNANMQTPADGGRPRMRMYVFPSTASMLDIQSPAGIAAKRNIGISMSGPQDFDITGEILRATFVAGTCNVTNAAALAGKLALFDFDNTDGTGCSFSTRITRLTTQTTATAIVMAYTSAPASANLVANITGYVVANTKPVATISWNSAAPIKTELAVPNVVNVRLNRVPDRDGSLDNQIVAHEWGHYISNRLIGNALGLASNNSGGLGEGWGDFTSILLTVREDDTAVPTNAAWNGAYAMATYATSGTDFNGTGNNGYYFGIRRMPYSTDMAINNLTYRHTANGQTIPAGPPIAFGANGASNSEVHNTGEVWAEMMWECYASLLRDTQGGSPRIPSFLEAQNRMKDYLVAGYKATPSVPTLLEARDAVLAAALAGDPQDFAGCSAAFAKRGAGTRAIAPDRYSATNVGVVEDFNAGADLSFVSAVLDDSITSFDNDGYLDSGETGNLTITLKNTGFAAVAATTSEVSSNTSSLTYPSGNTVNFPTMQPFATSTVTIPVHSLNQNGIQQTEFTITSNSPSLAGGANFIPTPVSGTYREYTNADLLLNVTATDNVEANVTPWTISSNPAFAQGAGDKFHRRNLTLPIDYEWHVPDHPYGSDQYLTSPVFTVDGSGSVNVQFDHTWSFEFDAGGNYDGGVVEMSVNGGAFTDVGTGYNGTILNQGVAVQPLSGRQGYVQNGSTHTSITQAVAPGSTVRFRFRAASDSAVGTTNGWFIDNIAFTGVVETPFAVLLGELAPTAAAVSVGGRVTTAFGQGIPRVTVSLTGFDGVTKTAITNQFGFYRFDNVTSGQSYSIEASAKRYRFTPRIITVMGELTDVDITPNL